MISFAITAFEEMSRPQLYGQRILDCIRPAQEHESIGEIVIVDDGSHDFARLDELLCVEPKVVLCNNHNNLGVFGNKLEAIACTTGEWVITCDSDNLMDKAFLDRVVSLDKRPDTWYCPSFAKTHFDYRTLIGEYTLATAGEMVVRPMAGCLMNTGNQTVHYDTFMSVFEQYRRQRADLMMPNWLNVPEDKRAEKHWRLVFDANDSFIFNMEWLTAGNRMQVVGGLEYDHYYGSGPESNYARAPAEKSALNDKLVEELTRRSLEAQAHA